MASKVIFVSYRREDVPDAVGRIFDRLVGAFGENAVFKDVDTLPVGAAFEDYIIDVLSDCKIVLAVIGASWLAAKSPDGTRRLDLVGDWVRAEIGIGLKTEGITVIPILHADTRMPGRHLLPDDLKALCGCNAANVRRDPDFHRDMDRLIAAINATLDGSADQAPPLRKEIARLTKEKEELEVRMREDQAKRDLALAAVVEREKEARAVADSKAREVEQLRLEVERHKRPNDAFTTQLHLNEKEASRLTDLAGAEAATRQESQRKALADLANDQNLIIRREEQKKLESLLESSRALLGTEHKDQPVKGPGFPAAETGTPEDAFLENDRQRAEARKIASNVVRKRTPEIVTRRTTPPDANKEALPRRTSTARARAIASRLSRLEPVGDVGLAMHYATQIEQQQGIRIPILLFELPPPPLGQYEAFLPKRPRVSRWHLDVGEVAVVGERLVDVVVDGKNISITAQEDGVLLSRLVDVGGYIPSSGVIGYLHPR